MHLNRLPPQIKLIPLHSVSETKWHTSNDDWSMRSTLEWLYNDAADDISIFFRAVSAL